jgi:cytochrome c-type biogenesis protein CcmH/NrfF
MVPIGKLARSAHIHLRGIPVFQNDSQERLKPSQDRTRKLRLSETLRVLRCIGQNQAQDEAKKGILMT